MIYRNLITPILDRLDSEQMHHAAREGLSIAERFALGRTVIRSVSGSRPNQAKLQTKIGDLPLSNPVMVAAGWDKDARAVRGLYEMGFSAIEVGSILVRPQPGNPKPRQWMIGPGVALNWNGFTSAGLDVAAANLGRYTDIPVGINIGKNKDVSEADAPVAYATVARRLAELGKFFVVNVSSPNTPGLRKLQDGPLLREILAAVKEALPHRPPLFVKVAPDLTFEALDDVLAVVLELKLSGIVTSNTSNNADLKGKYGVRWRETPGGLSGDDAEYRAISTSHIRHLYRSTKGSISIIGVGGVKDGITALEKIRAGASAVQVMTAIRGEGPQVANRINREIDSILTAEGISSIGAEIGREA